MPLYRFIGIYTGRRNSITISGVTFEGRAPSECDCPRIAKHPEFELVEGDEAPAKPKRGRPRKAD